MGVLKHLTLACSTLFLLTACHRDLPTHEEQGYVFGTLVEVSIYGEDDIKAQKAVTSVMQEFQRLHDALHAWKPSELSELNTALARGENYEVSPEVETMLQDAAQLSAQSGDLFNPAIGELVQVWGFHADEFKAELPDARKISELVAANPRMSDLTFTEAKQDVAFGPATDGFRTFTVVGTHNKAVQLDLGGYAKGYALDRAAAILHQQGIHNALINIGGNVMALGAHGDRPWRIAIQHPRKPGPIATLELRDGEAIGTSGDYQRYFELNGKRYCHLIDPRTGYPVQGVQAVSILVRGERAGTLSDAPSKPLFISGVNGWREAARQMKVEDAMLIDAEGVVHITASLRKRLEFTDKATVIKEEP